MMEAYELFYYSLALAKFIDCCLENMKKSKYVRRNLPRLISYLYERNYDFKLNFTQPKLKYIFRIYQERVQMSILFIFNPPFKKRENSEGRNKEGEEKKKIIFTMFHEEKTDSLNQPEISKRRDPHLFLLEKFFVT